MWRGPEEKALIVALVVVDNEEDRVEEVEEFARRREEVEGVIVREESTPEQWELLREESGLGRGCIRKA